MDLFYVLTLVKYGVGTIYVVLKLIRNCGKQYSTFGLPSQVQQSKNKGSMHSGEYFFYSTNNRALPKDHSDANSGFITRTVLLEY